MERKRINRNTAPYFHRTIPNAYHGSPRRKQSIIAKDKMVDC
jgi:hypothetical protein